ncbi:MAG: CRTAC1 family protein [Candidatus Sulfotelmatobacter sp.]
MHTERNNPEVLFNLNIVGRKPPQTFHFLTLTEIAAFRAVPFIIESAMRHLLPALTFIGLLGLFFGFRRADAAIPTDEQPAKSESIRFEDIAAKAGLRFTTQNAPTANKNQIETMVSGVALLDYDGDGYLDIYLVNGAAIPSLQKDSPTYWNRLFHNNQDGSFTDVTERAGVAGAGYGMGVAVGDFDNDGRPDIFLASVTGNQLFHNNGDGTFTDVTAKARLSGAQFNGKKMWSVGAGWFDYNNDGLLDLFVVNYCVWEVNKDPYCPLKSGVRGYCHPKNYTSLHDTLYRNNGDGTFTDVSKETGIDRYFGKGMSVSFADYDGDGYMDAFVANDTTPAFLFHNLGGKRFEEVGVAAGVAYAPDGATLSGMGSDFSDVNNDGRPDIWYTAVEHQTFPLLINNGSGEFDDLTQSSGLQATKEMSGWSNGIFDFDDDGWKDLFVARANVLDNISELTPSRKYPEPNSVFRNVGKGKFVDVSLSAGPDFQIAGAHRGAAFGDLFNDGHIDAVVSVLGGQVKLLRNISETGNHWILLKLVGARSNRMGLGAQIHITTGDGKQQWNQATTSVGYTSSSDSRVHFGLGKNARIKEIEIRWPGRIKQTLHDVAADQILTVEESK